MSLQEESNAVLKTLYNGYIQSPGSIFEVGSIIKDTKIDPFELCKYLEKQGFLKNVQNSGGKNVYASITISGINKIDPDFVEDLKSKIISVLGMLGGRHRVMEVLSLEPKDFQLAFDIVKYLESLGLLKDSQYQHNNIVIELSIEGLDYYEQNKASFL